MPDTMAERERTPTQRCISQNVSTAYAAKCPTLSPYNPGSSGGARMVER